MLQHLGKIRDQSAESRRSSWPAYAGIALGALILLVLAYWTGVQAILAPLLGGGPALLLLSLLAPLELGPRALAWRWVHPAPDKFGWRHFITAMWLGQSVNRLVPTASIGGDIVRARYLHARGGDTNDSVASLIADKAAQAAGAVGLLLLGWVLVAVSFSPGRHLLSLLFAALGLALGVAFFIQLQRSSRVSGLLSKWSAADDQGPLAKARLSAERIETRLQTLYASPRYFMGSVALRVLAHSLMAVEIWLAAWLMGHPVGLYEALLLRVVAFGARNLLFIVWGGLGVQESAYALLAPWIGLSPGTLIAISLATRIREVVIALPGALVWLTGEGLRASRAKQRELAGPTDK